MNKIMKITSTVCVMAAALMVMVTNVFAEADLDFTKKAGVWISEQLFWIALVVVIGILIGAFLKRSYVGMIITILAGGVVCYIIANPTIVSAIGEALGKLIGLAA